MASGKEHRFIATAPAEGDTNPRFTAYATGTAPLNRFFDYGVNVQGKTCGAFASAVIGAPKVVPGSVRGKKPGVCAIGVAVGVYGEVDDKNGIGLHGMAIHPARNAEGVGVKGEASGPGGEFRSEKGPQLRLPPITRERPPRTGKAGDLLVIADAKQDAHLWFCTHSAQGARPACWRRVAFDLTHGPCPEF